MIRQEFAQLTGWDDRHRLLLARLAIVLLATAAIDVVGSVLVYHFERHVPFTEIRSFGDALFFTTVQLLTVSSQIRNPLTTAGPHCRRRLEIWAVIVVAGSAGAIASFFQTADR